MKKTIAIIGATTPEGEQVAAILSKEAGYRLLLISPDTPQLAAVAARLKSSGQKIDMETMECTFDASWEADIIVLTIPREDIDKVVAAIAKVVTGKGVIYISPGDATEEVKAICELLPYSCVVKGKAADILSLVQQVNRLEKQVL